MAQGGPGRCRVPGSAQETELPGEAPARPLRTLPRPRRGRGGRVAEVRAQEQYGELVTPLRALDELSRALQDEAVVTAWYMSTDRASSVPLGVARAHTDAAIAAFASSQSTLADAGTASAELGA